MIPKESLKYFVELEDGCWGWKGRKYYGRPAWTLWMQRAVWEAEHGPLPARSTVNETCSTRGCLSVDHLGVRTRPTRTPATICRRCGGTLSRDVNDKTYCQQCNALRQRIRRNVQDNQE